MKERTRCDEDAFASGGERVDIVVYIEIRR